MSKKAARQAGAGDDGRAAKKKLKRTRREAKDFLAEARRLARRYGKRLQPETLARIQAGVDELAAALKGEDAEQLGKALERLDALVEKHLGFARRSPALQSAIALFETLAIVLVLRLFVVEPFKIPSGSMIPTLQIGDQLFVNKLSYGVRLPVVDKNLLHWGGYQRGDVIVFVTPQDDGLPLMQRRDFIKRIVGLPGDTVEVRDEVVYVNGVAQPRELAERDFGFYDRMGDDGPWVAQRSERWKERLLDAKGETVALHDVLREPERRHVPQEGPFQVPAGHLFMMGDNRDNSADGREGGWYVPFGHVKGRAFVIWLSWGKPGLGVDGVGLRLGRLFTAVR